MNSNTVATGTAQDWNKYWQGAGLAGAYSDGGVSHPAIASYWATLFAKLAEGNPSYRLLDVATGNGAVLETAVELLGDNLAASCVDISDAAIAHVTERFPGVTGLTADAADLPLDDATFDLVVSQFGVEYAGIDAIGEAARLVANDGMLVLLMHSTDGLIHKECARNLAAIERLIETDFVPLAERFFQTGFAAVRGDDRSVYEAAGKALAPAIASVEAIMQEYGEDITGGTIAQLYTDVARIHEKIASYDPDEVLSWIRAMANELDSYRGRMASMNAAALTEDAFRTAVASIESSGFDVQVADALYGPESSDALGWLLTARKTANG